MTDLQENLKLMLEQLSYEQAMTSIILDKIGQEEYERLKEYKLNTPTEDRNADLKLFDAMTYFICKINLLQNEIGKLESENIKLNLVHGTGSFLI